MAELVEATWGQRLQAARELFLEYAASLPISLCFQDFDKELTELPGRYAPPGGTILLALVDDQPAGCVAVRPLDEPGVCEMKRLFVRPAYRAHKLGRALAEAAIAFARQAGYTAMRLDTLSSMTQAIALYQSLGFTDTAPYCHNPHDNARYLELTL